MGGGGQGGCERRIEVFVKIQKIKKLGGGSGLGGQGGCVRIIEVFCENSKKNWGGEGRSGGSGRGVGLRGVRVDVIEELKFLGKFTKKKFMFMFIKIPIMCDIRMLQQLFSNCC